MNKETKSNYTVVICLSSFTLPPSLSLSLSLHPLLLPPSLCLSLTLSFPGHFIDAALECAAAHQSVVEMKREGVWREKWARVVVVTGEG